MSSQMKTVFSVLIIYLNIYCTVWAQTTNNETSAQLSGNTELSTHEIIIQTPKTGDNLTQYETTTTTIQSNDFITNNMSSETTTVTEKSIEVTESTTELINIETTTNNSPTQQESQTQNIDFGNSSSMRTTNQSEEQQTTVLSTTYASIVSSNEPNDNTNNTSNQLYIKSSKALNISDNETNESFNTISGNELHSGLNTEEITINKTSNFSEESYSSTTESSPTNNYSDSNNSSETITTPKMSPNSEPIINSSPLMVETTQLYKINSTQTTETSTHIPSAQTTQQIQTTTINTLIESNSGLKIEESTQITEMPINASERQTVPNHYHILSALVTSDKPIDQNNQTYYTSTEIPQNSNLNDSEINNTSIESIVHSNSAEVETLETPIPNIISSLSEIPKIINTTETTQTNGQKETTQTISVYQTLRPTTESIRLSTESVELTSESIASTHSEPTQRTQLKLSTESSEISSHPISYTQTTQPKEMTHFQSHSTEATVTEKTTEKATQPTQQTQTTEIPRENQNTESSAGVLTSNDSEPSIDSETTFKQPLTDHSLKTTQYFKPITTSIPIESNISAITVTLPNIKYIQSISKEDMVNIVTITFITKSIDIFRWVSINDQIFRNFTCNQIDIEREWCTIDRFVYLSPSPLVINNHLILNFFIDDSTDNDLNNYHVFGGPLIVEALKNSTNSLEAMMGMKVMSLQTNLGTMVVKPLEKDSPERLAKFELLVFIFTVVMFICTVLLCLAIICSCAKRKSVDMNQIQLSNCGRRQTINGGFDLNSASNILRDENQEKPLNHNVINLDGWVAPIEQVECEKITKYDNLQDTKL